MFILIMLLENFKSHLQKVLILYSIRHDFFCQALGNRVSGAVDQDLNVSRGQCTRAGAKGPYRFCVYSMRLSKPF